MANRLTVKEDFVFLEEDLIPPEEVIQEYADQIKDITRNYVCGIVKPYTGHIESYTKVSFATALSNQLNFSDDKEYNIQENLGTIGNVTNKFEFYLGSDKLPNYKFRILFFEYEIGAYPVKLVLEQCIADELKGMKNSNYTLKIKNTLDLNNMITKILSTTRIHDVIQGMINASIIADKKIQQQSSLVTEEKTNSEEELDTNDISDNSNYE